MTAPFPTRDTNLKWPFHPLSQNHFRVNPRAARWGLLGVFLIGYLVCDATLGDLPSSFMVFTILNACACALLLSMLSRPLAKTVWVWMALFLFIDGYFGKMFWIAYKLNDPGYINKNFPEIRWVTRQTLLDGYPWITLGFVVFCLSASLVLLLHSTPPRSDRTSSDRVRVGAALDLVVVTFILYLLSALLQLSYGYGVAGLANPELPFRTGSLLTLFQRFVAPTLLVLCIWVFDRAGRRRLANATVAVALICAVIDGLLSTSRGTIILYFAPIFVLWLLTKTASRGRYAFTSLVIVGSVLLYPTLSALRLNKITGTSSTSVRAPSVADTVTSGFFIIARFGAGGADGVWYALSERGDLSMTRLLHFLRPHVLNRYYTSQVVHVPTPNDHRAPGTVASLMIVGGAAGVVVLTPLLLGLIAVAWARLCRLRTWPVALAIASGSIATFISGGVFDFSLFVKTFVSAMIAEYVYLKVLRYSDSRSSTIPQPAPTNVP